MGSIIAIDQDAMREQFKRKLEPKYATRLFQLRDIPSVMRSRLGWPVAAALMERWFRGAAFEMPPAMKNSDGVYRLSNLASIYLDETTVTMRWALGYARVQVAMNTLRATWASPAGIQLLKRRIDNQGVHRVGQRWRFGDLAQPAKVLGFVAQTIPIGLVVSAHE